MKTPRLFIALAALSLWSIAPARADVIYFGLQNIAIPTDQTGVYLNLQTGVTTSSGNWDINPFFGGTAVANSPNFQPARVGANPGNETRLMRFDFGNTISASLNYSSGYGGSSGHIGSGADQFQPNAPAYIGYRYTPGGTTFNGWMRAILNPNTAGGMLMDWAYETSGGSIAAGDIQQAAATAGVSLVTLTAATGESPVLGSNLADVGSGSVTAVAKNGVGTWTLGNQSYTGATTINAGTLAVGAGGGKLAGTSSITVNNGGTLLLTNNTTADRINDAATVTMAAGSTFNTGGFSESTPPPPLVSTGPMARIRTDNVQKNYGERRFFASRRAGMIRDEGWWSGDNRLAAREDAVIRGGALYNRGGASVASVSSGLGALTLQGTQLAPVVFDFGTLGGSTLLFSALNASSAGSYVTIQNWSGLAGIDNGAASNDRFLFATNPNFSLTDLANFNFSGYGAGARQISYNGYFELVPVPEPSTWAAGILSVLALGYSQRRRFFFKSGQRQ